MENEEWRPWMSDSGLVFYCHPKCCVFCDNCTDIWYDFSGPYWADCDKFFPTDIGAKDKCEHFIEEFSQES